MLTVPQCPPQGARWLTCRHGNLTQDQVIQLLHVGNSVRPLQQSVTAEELTVLHYASHTDVQQVVNVVKPGINIAYFFPLLKDGKLTTLESTDKLQCQLKQNDFSFIGERKLQAAVPSIDWWQIGMSYNHALDKSHTSRNRLYCTKSKINYKSPVCKLQKWNNLRNQRFLTSSVIQYVSKTEDAPRRLITKYKSKLQTASVIMSGEDKDQTSHLVKWTRVSPKYFPKNNKAISTTTINPSPQWYPANPSHRTPEVEKHRERKTMQQVRWLQATPNQSISNNSSIHRPGVKEIVLDGVRWFHKPSNKPGLTHHNFDQSKYKGARML